MRPNFSLYGCTALAGPTADRKARPSLAHWKREPSRLETLVRPAWISRGARSAERYPTEH